MQGTAGDITGSCLGRAALGGEKETQVLQKRCVMGSIPVALTLGCRPCCGHNQRSHCSFATKRALFAELPICPVAHLSPSCPLCHSGVCWQHLTGCCRLCRSSRDPVSPVQQTQTPSVGPQNLQILDR